MKKTKRKKNKYRIHNPSSIQEAILELESFFEADMWYACLNEWHNESVMLDYIHSHFNILKKQTNKLIDNKLIEERNKISIKLNKLMIELIFQINGLSGNFTEMNRASEKIFRCIEILKRGKK